MARKRLRPRGCITLLLFVVVMFICFFGIDMVKEWLFPQDHREEITEICEPYGMDPWLVMAVIREESGFEEDACSSAGACGLMQIMPTTAEWIVSKGTFDFTAEDVLTDPHCNIQAGVWYLNWLLHHYDGNTQLTCAVAAYNAGHATVDGWLKEGVWDGSTETLAQIPYAETQKYVEYVLKSREMYHDLYGG